MNFWDLFTINLMLDVRDYHREKAAKKAKELEFQHKISNEITEEMRKMIELVSQVFLKLDRSAVPKEIVTGTRMLPYYLLSRVLADQRSNPTMAQNILLDACFKTISVGFNKKAFLTDNRVMKELHEMMGISPDYLGTFWRLFLKSIRITESEETIVEKIGEHAAMIMVRFAVLGDADENTTVNSCENFIKDLLIHSVLVADAPAEKIDYFGEVPFAQHKKKAENIVYSLYYASGATEDEELEFETVTKFLKWNSVVPLFELIDRCQISEKKKIEIMETALILNGEYVGMEADYLFHALKNRNEEGNNLMMLTEVGQITLVVINACRADRTEDIFKYFEEMTSHLVGIEHELAKRYPNCGLGSMASEIIAERMIPIAEYIKQNS